MESRKPKFSKGEHGLFADKSNKHRPAKKLLGYVMNGDPVSAEKLLKQYQQEHPNACLVTERTTEKEKNGRRWDAPVSPLEFSSWTGDVTESDDTEKPGIVNMLLRYVPAEHVKEAREQMEAVKNNGTQHGVMMGPFYALIEIYKKYDEIFDQFKNDYKRDQYCEKTIGKLQDNLTIFGLQWICDDKLLASPHPFNQAPKRQQHPFTLENHPSRHFFKHTFGSPKLSMRIKGELTALSLDYSEVMLLPHPNTRKIASKRAEAFEKLCCTSVANLDHQIGLLQKIEESNKPVEQKSFCLCQ